MALASLMTAVQEGTVKPDDYVLVNITGIGKDRLRMEGSWKMGEPFIEVDPDNYTAEDIKSMIEERLE